MASDQRWLVLLHVKDTLPSSRLGLVGRDVSGVLYLQEHLTGESTSSKDALCGGPPKGGADVPLSHCCSASGFGSCCMYAARTPMNKHTSEVEMD